MSETKVDGWGLRDGGVECDKSQDGRGKGKNASRNEKMTEDQRLIPRAKPRRRWCGPGSAEKKMLE